ncbi:MAG: thioether cross-link-forming SCIFF peptide maturase [Candidatus Paraimprobicoccus trichonymphae]|uniref:Thioether cross-link-forming SCIFF peptide maturase n=1 Tax=Candidatus Paraimprobicoccus trichonymphae TaxID=3033793 RepID=A0AA48L1J7_9FIRM|nr:MAG: thioether cross-link-forming SCIFF peptide maturase [Candidatus Paraimprobicoccus trichonymphae]
MIHKYKLNNFNIVLDTNSGAIHCVDDVCYDILENMSGEDFKNKPSNLLLKKLLNKYDKNEIVESYNEICGLVENGQLFSQENEFYKKNFSFNFQITALCLNISHDCNLRCKYCFAYNGTFGSEKKLMDLNTAKKAVDFLIEKSGDMYNLEIDFFGGEPLLNFEVVKQTVYYAKNIGKKYNKKFKFTITTNGLLLNEDNIYFINEEFYNVVLSLDGRKSINDKFRITKLKEGSYDSIVPKFKKLVESRKDKECYVRATYTRYNLDFLQDILHIYNLGFENLSVEPVIADCNLDYSIGEENLEKILLEYENLANKIIEFEKESKKINFFLYNIDLENSPCKIKRLKSCSCGNEYVAITPQGDIFPCHQFVNYSEFKMGNLYSNNFNEDLKLKFSKITIYKKEKCESCWAKFYCTGGCNANNYMFNKNICKPYEISCKIQKKKLECAIMLKFFRNFNKISV